MRVLLDTNILTRAAQPNHPMHSEALDALDVLRKRGEDLCLIPQNLYEFWAVATRPLTANGLGMTPPQAGTELSRLKRLFLLLNDSSALYQTWETLVIQYSVSGKNAHDARIVAAMTVHQISHLLTFNVDDFQRFSGITLLTPASVLTIS